MSQLTDEAAAQDARIADLQRAVGQLEGEVARLQAAPRWEPVPDNLTIVFPDTGSQLVGETGEVVRLCRRLAVTV